MNYLRKISSSLLANRYNVFHQFGNSARQEHSITRDWLAKLWQEERKKLAARRKNKGNVRNHRARDTGSVDASPFRSGFAHSLFSRAAPVEEEENPKKAVNQRPVSQNLGGALSPTYPEEVSVGLKFRNYFEFTCMTIHYAL